MTSVHPWNDVRIFHKECRSLAEAGFDVHLVACAPKSQVADSVTLNAVPAALGGRLARMLKTAWRVYRQARAVNAEIYHFHDPELLPYGLLLTWQGKQVIYDAHEDVPRDILSKAWIAPQLRRLVAWAFEFFEDGAARRLAAVVGATPHIARRFSQYNRCAVDINNYPMASELSDGRASGGSDPVVCYVGGITRIRGAVEMIAAVEKLDVRLILAGKFENPALEAELRAMPGWRKVDYRGLVDRQEVVRIYAESRIGLLCFHPEPNHVDAQPNKLFEYMSAGLAVIASDFPLWREVLDGAGAGIRVDPLDANAIASAIDGLLRAPDQVAMMGRSGREAVLAKYRWEPEARRLVELYKQLGGEKPEVRP